MVVRREDSARRVAQRYGAARARRQRPPPALARAGFACRLDATARRAALPPFLTMRAAIIKSGDSAVRGMRRRERMMSQDAAAQQTGAGACATPVSRPSFCVSVMWRLRLRYG